MSDYQQTTSGMSFGSTIRDSDAHNDQKCTMPLEDDRLDSGLGSITPQDAEKEQRLDEMFKEKTEPDAKQQQMSIDHDGRGVRDSISERFNQESSSDLGVQSITEKDEMYDAYIPITEFGTSTLHNSILENHANKAIELIANCPEPACLDFFTSEVFTALHLAVYKDLPEIVRLLIVYGANFNSQDRRGNTPLHLACELGRLSCVKMIVSPLDETESIGIQEQKLPQDINMRNFEGLTPLHLATIQNRPKVVEFLVQHPQIQVNVGDSTCGRTALHHALERRRRQCFINLLKGAVNVNATTYDGCSPLHVAVGLDLEQETRCLMCRGANVQMTTTDDVRAMDLAKTQKIQDALQYSMLQMRNLVLEQR